jgi:hypothetical protein
MRLREVLEPANNISITSNGGSVICGEPCFFYGFMLGLDGTNDPTITFYDNASEASGEEIIPTNTYDASILGLNGAMLPVPKYCKNGIYVGITQAGTTEIEPLLLMKYRTSIVS